MMMEIYKFGDVSVSAGGKFVTTIMANNLNEAIFKYKASELYPEKNILKKQFGTNEDGTIIISNSVGDVLGVLKLSECQDFNYEENGFNLKFNTKKELREKIEDDNKEIASLKDRISEFEIMNSNIINSLGKEVEEYDFDDTKFNSSFETSIFALDNQVEDGAISICREDHVDFLETEKKMGFEGKRGDFIKFIVACIENKVNNNAIFFFNIDDNSKIAFAFKGRSCNVIYNSRVKNVNKFYNYVFKSIYGADYDSLMEEKKIDSAGDLLFYRHDFKNIKKWKFKEVACAFILGKVTEEIVQEAVMRKQESEKQFLEYLDRNEKKIGIDGNIALRVTLEHAFGIEFGSNMKNVTIKKLKDFLNGLQK